MSLYCSYLNQFYFPGWAAGWAPWWWWEWVLNAQTWLPDVTTHGSSLFCCCRDRLLPENIVFLCLFFFFFLSISSVPLSFQIKLSPRGLFLPGCVPWFLHASWQAWGVFYLRRSPHMQEAYFFTGTFWDWPLLGLFTPCLFLLPLAQPSPHFRGFWGPLCKFLESVDYSCPGFTENGICDNSQFCFCNISSRSTYLGIQIQFSGAVGAALFETHRSGAERSASAVC